MFKVKNKGTRTMLGFEHISHLVPSVSTVNFEHIIGDLVFTKFSRRQFGIQ